VTAHWGVADPAALEGDLLSRTNAFRQAFRELENRIKIFASLPIGLLDRLRLQRKVDEIGRVRLDEPEEGTPPAC
jgi:hypothetical protein